MRDKDIDDEIIAMLKQRPNLVLIPNLPDRGVKTDLSWLKGSMSDEELDKLEKANVDNPQTQCVLQHPGAQPGQDERRGRADRDGHRRQPAVGPA